MSEPFPDPWNDQVRSTTLRSREMAVPKDALKNPAEEFAGQTIGWHRHRWTTWGGAISEAGLVGAFAPTANAFQRRSCTRCYAEERRRVPILGAPPRSRPRLTATDVSIVIVWGMLGGLVPSIVYAALDLTGAWR